MNVLVIGEGGREHALAWKLRQSSRVERVFVAPGNAGTAMDAENVDIAPTDWPRLIKFAQQNKVRLTVVGPETPLVPGIVDAFSEAKLRVFGPARGGRTRREQGLLQEAAAACRRAHGRLSGLSQCRPCHPISARSRGRAGRGQGRRTGRRQGVFVCPTRAEAIEAVKRIGRNREFGDAGNQIVSRNGSTARKSACWRSPTAARLSRCRRPRTTSAPTTTTLARTPAAWGPTALPRWSPRRCCIASRNRCWCRRFMR